MSAARRSLRVYWAVVGLCLALLCWWGVYFFRQGDVLVRRALEAGAPLDGMQARAIRDATRDTMVMFAVEGAVVALALVGGMVIVLRVLKQEADLGERQRAFLSGVTHELRSPLASAKIAVESLLLGRVPEEKRARYLNHAKEDLERLDGMVEEMLDGARMANKTIEVHPEPLDLAAFVVDLQQELKTQGSMSGALIEFHVPNQEVAVTADPAALERILRNLVSNAVKYGGDPSRVDVSVRRDAGDGLLEVRDYGPGLGGADRRKLFMPFVRGPGDVVRKRPGVGLGLYLVAELTRALGGRVTVEDGLDGGGTRMLVALPGRED